MFGGEFSEESFVHPALVGDLVAGGEEVFNVVPYQNDNEHEWDRYDKVPIILN